MHSLEATPPTASEQLHSLVYVSSAAQVVAAADLRHLLERAQERNTDLHVTGVLLFDSGNFMQYIEGPAAGLQEVYEHIKRDTLHTGIIELCFEQPEARLFAGWAMGARAFGAAEFSKAWVHDEVLAARIVSLPRAANAAAALLRGFWHRSHDRQA